MQLATYPEYIQKALFQPSSDLQAGCNPCERRSPPPEPRCFNPHPTFRPDATRCRKRTPTTSTRFQPSSDLQAGCNVPAVSICPLEVTVFQPSSDLQAGCNHRGRHRPGPGLRCFNPHPTFRPDATFQQGFWLRVPVVSTLIRPSGRMQHGVPVIVPHLFQVSTLIRPSGRMQPARRVSAAASRCFNPHPTFRPDATPVPGFPIGSSRTSSTMPLDGHFWDEMFKRLTRAATRTRTSSVRGRQQWVRVTPRGGRRSRPRCPARIPRLVGPGCRAACKTGCCPASRR